MKKSMCGADCENCSFGMGNGCKGCGETKGCPFGKACFIAERITADGEEGYRAWKAQLVKEFNALNVTGMPEICELFPLNGEFVNLAYPLPNGNTVKLLDDRDVYLGNQVERIADGEEKTCYGMVAGRNFLLVCEYGEGGANPEIVVYQRREVFEER